MAIDDTDVYDFEALSRVLPQVQRFTVPEDYDIDAKAAKADYPAW